MSQNHQNQDTTAKKKRPTNSSLSACGRRGFWLSAVPPGVQLGPRAPSAEFATRFSTAPMGWRVVLFSTGPSPCGCPFVFRLEPTKRGYCIPYPIPHISKGMTLMVEPCGFGPFQWSTQGPAFGCVFKKWTTRHGWLQKSLGFHLNQPHEGVPSKRAAPIPFSGQKHSEFGGGCALILWHLHIVLLETSNISDIQPFHLFHEEEIVCQGVCKEPLHCLRPFGSEK